MTMDLNAQSATIITKMERMSGKRVIQ